MLSWNPKPDPQNTINDSHTRVATRRNIIGALSNIFTSLHLYPNSSRTNKIMLQFVVIVVQTCIIICSRRLHNRRYTIACTKRFLKIVEIVGKNNTHGCLTLYTTRLHNAKPNVKPKSAKRSTENLNNFIYIHTYIFYICKRAFVGLAISRGFRRRFFSRIHNLPPKIVYSHSNL